MTTRPLLHCLRVKLLALAATTLVASPSCMQRSMMWAPEFSKASRPASKPQPAKAAQPRSLPANGRYPDPRYRQPVNFAELQYVAAEVGKATGRKPRWRLALGKDPGPLARIVVKTNESTIYLHPVGAQTLPPNTWAFIFGHEFAHEVESLGNHTPDNPSIELKADIAGARYAMAAGYRLEAFLGWVLTEPNGHSKSHGTLHDRVWSIAAHFHIPRNVILAEKNRYLNKQTAR